MNLQERATPTECSECGSSNIITEHVTEIREVWGEHTNETYTEVYCDDCDHDMTEPDND